MRLFEGELRTDSITASAPEPNCSTQASNFSLRIRSGTVPLINTASIPNCLKQSDKTERVGSGISTRATRAQAFLLRRGGVASTVPKAFCMAVGNALKLHFGLYFRPWQRVKRPMPEYKGLITGHGRERQHHPQS